MFEEFGIVQAKILTKLLKSDGLRYSQAYPGEEIDDDLYNYHLQFLVKKGYVEKTEGVYKLTEVGKVATQMYDSRGEWKDLFKVSVVIYVIDIEKKLILGHERKRHPYQGDVGGVSGKVNYGERLVEAAKRKLKEETGLEGEVNMIGSFRKTIRCKGKITEDSIYLVFKCEDYRGVLIEENEFGKNKWMKREEIDEREKKNMTRHEVQEKIIEKVFENDREMFFYEEELELESI